MRVLAFIVFWTALAVAQAQDALAPVAAIAADPTVGWAVSTADTLTLPVAFVAGIAILTRWKPEFKFTVELGERISGAIERGLGRVADILVRRQEP